MRVAEGARRQAIGPEDSDTFANPHAKNVPGSAPTPLGRGELIRFEVDPDKYKHFDVRLQDGTLRVSASDGFAVFPQSSNVILVKLERLNAS
jgi:hypothetical protein